MYLGNMLSLIAYSKIYKETNAKNNGQWQLAPPFIEKDTTTNTNNNLHNHR
eukprot:c32332_g1_i1 orf=3-152(-)